nr:MAG TPA: hypothetical protein [Myoviridae sp. ct3tv2]DAR21244.1 MAG TPA: hypothetical protein [Caudoviricetes sp.]
MICQVKNGLRVSPFILFERTNNDNKIYYCYSETPNFPVY